MWAAALIVVLFLFLYPFLIYPAILFLLAKLKAGDSQAVTGTPPLPSVAIVICALNEQRIIASKIENSLALKYPREKLSIVVISDGSTDETATIALHYRPYGIQVIENSTRRGKVANLNEELLRRKEDVVVLSDANVLYADDAVLRLVSRFQDSSVGCVSGKVILTDSTPALDDSTKGYYSLEWFLQEQASRIHSMVGADGAMYAMRRELFEPCPNDTIVEDYIIPMNIVRQGKRVVFEPLAIGWERGPETLREEFRRKTRIAAGAAQGLVRGNAWPKGTTPAVWFIFLSHKLLRWLSPLTGLIALLLASICLDEPISRLIVVTAVLLGALAGIRLLAGWSHPVLDASFYFCFGQAAQAIGLLKGFSGKQSVLWPKANR